MQYHCRDCQKDFGATLVDGSCPDCYSSDAVEQRTSVQEGVPMPKEPVSAPAATGSRFLAAISSQTGNALQPVINPLASPMVAAPAPPVHNGLHAAGNHSAPDLPKIVPKYAMPKLRSTQSTTSVPVNTSLPVPSGSQILPQTFVGNRYTADGASSATVSQNPKLVFARALAKPLLQAPGKANPFAQLFTAVDHLSPEVMICLDACSDPVLLNAHANLMQNTIEIMDSIKLRLEERLKAVLKTDMSLYEAAHGRKRSDSGGSSVSSNPVTVHSSRPKRIISTIVAKKLPSNITEADLFAYFKDFCKERSEIQNINIARNPRTRECKGFAYVKLARTEIVQEICRRTRHKITVGQFNGVQHEILVEPFDELDQYKRRLKYTIFIGGVSSFMSEEDFVRIMTEKYGKIEDIYYHSNDMNPGTENGYVKLTFADPEINKKLLENGTIEINRRKLHCKPCEDSRKHAENMKKERGEINKNDKKIDNDKENSEGKKKEKKPDEDDSKGKCCVCLDEDVCMLFVPCNHLCVCEECSKMMDDCPYCRGRITKKSKVFIPN
ncbi:uncharacterized protein LOC129593553 [Paramacrobiotus metropolitanus]|uniref:uncharacterized protein LOC129593553 n=1 Tax=Paramacrobiotus metropolitanus TaxID=2943436 RepID=UPI0024465738|nr:uncharacterized protein LOC129593553 [Paramacrobiotus metropolitanus]